MKIFNILKAQQNELLIKNTKPVKQSIDQMEKSNAKIISEFKKHILTLFLPHTETIIIKNDPNKKTKNEKTPPFTATISRQFIKLTTHKKDGKTNKTTYNLNSGELFRNNKKGTPTDILNLYKKTATILLWIEKNNVLLDIELRQE